MKMMKMKKKKKRIGGEKDILCEVIIFRFSISIKNFVILINVLDYFF